MGAGPINLSVCRSPDYLQELVNEYQDTKDQDALTENDEKLKEFGIGGLCNLCLEQRNKEYIINNEGIPLIIDCLNSNNEDILTAAITILIFLLTPPTLEIAKTSILTRSVKKKIEELSKSENNISSSNNNGGISSSNSIKNLSIILLNDYFNKDLVIRKDQRQKTITVEGTNNNMSQLPEGDEGND
nr:4467_t:CDS:2 [Entrophospora candida]